MKASSPSPLTMTGCFASLRNASRPGGFRSPDFEFIFLVGKVVAASHPMAQCFAGRGAVELAEHLFDFCRGQEEQGLEGRPCLALR